MIYRLRYDIVDASEADWEEYFYHDVVKVKRGIATTSDETTLVALQGAGFVLIEEAEQDESGEEIPPPKRRPVRSS